MQKGLNFEDFELFTDREMRRDYLFETIMRQGYFDIKQIPSLLSYFISAKEIKILQNRKISEGFFVQDLVRKEVTNRIKG